MNLKTEIKKFIKTYATQDKVLFKLELERLLLISSYEELKVDMNLKTEIKKFIKTYASQDNKILFKLELERLLLISSYEELKNDRGDDSGITEETDKYFDDREVVQDIKDSIIEQTHD